MLQCAISTQRPQKWQLGMHSFQKVLECSVALEVFYLEPWRKRFLLVDDVRTLKYASGFDGEWRKSTHHYS